MSSYRGSSGRRREELETIGRFQRLEQIGKGSFALVYKGVHVRKRTIVAIKSVHLSKLNKKLKDNLISEIRILQSLHHPHIVALIDCIERDSMMHLVMEYCEIGDLSMFIKTHVKLIKDPITAGMFQKYPSNPVGGFHEVIVRHFMKQIGSAMEFIRAKNFVHRDIKPQNLLLNPSPLYYARNRPEIMPYQVDENSLVPATGIETLPMLKIADFGFARFLEKTAMAETLCGSPLYMAPEILRYEKYDAKADLWSIGTVLYEMLYAKAPFRAGNHVELLAKIDKQNDVIRFSSSVQLGSEMRNLIEALLKKAPIERIGFDRFFDHPIIKGPIPGLVGEDKEAASRGTDSASSSRRLPRQQTQTQERSPDVGSQEQELQDYAHNRTPATPPGRPSRPSTGQVTAAASPTIADERRHPSRSPPSDQYGQSRGEQQRRPTISSHQTAPGRPSQAQERAAAAALGQPERRHSKKQTSPRTSVLKEQLERDRATRAAQDRRSREIPEQDTGLERDYVYVEKRAVEVNAVADELLNAPQVQARPTQPPTSAAMTRRATTQAIPTSQAVSRASQTVSTTGKQRTDVAHQRTGSYERRYGRPNLASATSVIAKALKEANLRVFGPGLSPPNLKGISPPRHYGSLPTHPNSQTSLTFVGAKSNDSKDEDMRVIYYVEELATRGDVIMGFAEVKYMQLLPSPQLHEQGLGIDTAGNPYDAPGDEDELIPSAVVEVSEEALVLYVKSLAILARAIQVAGSWFGPRQRGEVAQLDPAVPRSSPTTGSAGGVGGGKPVEIMVMHRVNTVVQWCRNQFNEVLERSEFICGKLVEAQSKLPPDHHCHPSNHPIAVSGSSANSIGTSVEKIPMTTGVTAEKLIYERATEMTRQAARRELIGRDLPGCEIEYKTAIRMLEAILDDDEAMREASIHQKDSSTAKGAGKDESINGLKTEDRQHVVKLIEAMRQRLRDLRRKIEIQQSAAKRTPTGTSR